MVQVYTPGKLTEMGIIACSVNKHSTSLLNVCCLMHLDICRSKTCPCSEGESFFLFNVLYFLFAVAVYFDLFKKSLLLNHYVFPHTNRIALSRETLKQLVLYEQSASLQVSQKIHQLLQSLGNETLILGSSTKSFRGLMFYSCGGVCLYISKLLKSV